jgi:hypothetical protein
MRLLLALVLTLAAMLSIVGYTTADPDPDRYMLRMGFLVSAMLTSAAAWVLFRGLRRHK